MERRYLDFERPIEKIEQEIERLIEIQKTRRVDNQLKITQLQQLLKEKIREIYSGLDAFQKVQVARHPQRPHTLDYIGGLLDDFYELHGDRVYGDDPAIIAGIGKFRGKSIAVIGHQKGSTTEENISRNFGMAHPEGYKKALRVMKIAERFAFPVLTLIDTPGAHPHLIAEERNQALAIAQNLEEMSLLQTPIIAVIIGEGGSGGALGIGIGDRILMLEFAIYSVISPEGCASILWKNQKAVAEAANALKLTSSNLLEFKLIDEVVQEPLGGAHTQPKEMINILAEAIERNLQMVSKIPLDELLETRYRKFRSMGVFEVKEEAET